MVESSRVRVDFQMGAEPEPSSQNSPVSLPEVPVLPDQAIMPIGIVLVILTASSWLSGARD